MPVVEVARRPAGARRGPRRSLASPSAAFWWCAHARRVGRQRLVGDRPAQRRVRRRRLVAELGDEPGPVVAVAACSRRVPHVPDVHGAVRRVVGVQVVGARTTGCPASTGRVGSSSATIARQQVVVVAGAPGAARRAAPASPSRAQPQMFSLLPVHSTRLGWAASRTTCSRGLGRHLGGERLLLRVGGAGEQEVLPDQQPELVGEVVEVVGLVAAAAPDPQQVDVRVGRLAAAASASRSRVTRVGNASSGIQLTPRTKTGTSLTTSVNGPCRRRRGRCRAAPTRKPIAPLPAVERRRRPRRPASRRGRSAAGRRTRAATRGRGRGRPATRTAAVAPAGDRRPWRRLAATDADTVSGASDGPVEVDVHRRPDPSPPSTVTSGRTWASRAVDQRVQADRLPDAGGDQRRAPVPAEVAGHLADEVERLVVGVRPVAERGRATASAYAYAESKRDHAGRCRRAAAPARDVEAVARCMFAVAAELDAVERDAWRRCRARRRPGRPGRRPGRSTRRWSRRPSRCGRSRPARSRCRRGTGRGSARRRAGRCARSPGTVAGTPVCPAPESVQPACREMPLITTPFRHLTG